MTADLVALLPELVLSGLAMALLLFGLVAGGRRHGALGAGAVLSIVAAGVALWVVASGTAEGSRFFFGMFVLDRFAVFFKALFLLSSGLAILLSLDYLKRNDYRPAEYHTLVMFATVGMMVMASGANLATIYVGLELMALSTYILAGYFRREVKSHEAAVKYFVLGALSSGILLYGMSLLYGASGYPRPVGACRRGLRRAAGHADPGRRSRCLPAASSSRSRRCRSTCGRPTSTRARRRRSPRSCRWDRRRPPSRCSCASTWAASSRWPTSGGSSSPWRRR